jgi:hypothetical protein
MRVHNVGIRLWKANGTDKEMIGEGKKRKQERERESM